MPVDALVHRVRRGGAGPLVTHHDLIEDTRIELSATTFANWVDKTASLIDELGVVPGDVVWLPVAVDRPDHWVSLVWVWATWQAGCRPSLVPERPSEASLAVVGPAGSAQAIETVACSLHPLGAPLATCPQGVLDYSEVLAQPDVHWSAARPESPWADCSRTFAEVGEPATDRRILVVPTTPHEAATALARVVGGGSLVSVRGGAPERWRIVAASERASIVS